MQVQKKKPIILSSVDEQNLVSSYQNGATTKELCIKYGWSLNNRNGPLNILKKHNVLIRMDNETHAYRYRFIENYFEKIDTTDKAYFLGLMYSDGSVSYDRNICSISLQEPDKYILELFKNYLKYEKELEIYRYDSVGQQTTFRLNIHTKTFKSCLISQGCLPRKSYLQNTLPVLDEELMSHFIRGYFDGNGCVTYGFNSKYPNKLSPIIGFTGDRKFMEEIVSYLNKNLGLSIVKYQRRFKDREQDSGSITWGGKNVCKIFSDYIYKDKNELFLSRKYNKLDGLLKGNFKRVLL